MNSSIARFILNRSGDEGRLSRGEIAGTAHKWLLVLMGGAVLLGMLLVAPLAEELMFRLGLSFRRRTVALWAGLLPVVCAFYLYRCRTRYIFHGLAAAGALIYWLVCHFTTDGQWIEWRKRFIIPAIGFPPSASA